MRGSHFSLYGEGVHMVRINSSAEIQPWGNNINGLKRPKFARKAAELLKKSDIEGRLSKKAESTVRITLKDTTQKVSVPIYKTECHFL